MSVRRGFEMIPAEAKIAMLLGMIMCVIGVAGEGDYRSAVERDEEYCAMVEIYKSSRGEAGWPDYRGDYAEVCE